MICISCPTEATWDVVDSQSGPTSVLDNGGIECGACEKFQCGDCGDKARAAANERVGKYERANPNYDDSLCASCNERFAEEDLANDDPTDSAGLVYTGEVQP